MLGIYSAAAHIYGRTMDLFDIEQMEREADSDDVANRIDRTHLVKMHLLDIHAVHGRFGFTKHAEHVLRL